MAHFHRILGKKTAPLDAEDLAAASVYAGVEVDLGTGDARYVIDAAREDSDRYFIGMDAVAENMMETARRAGASKKKGGVDNALFVRGSAEQLPGPFEQIADRLTVLYPWGSLLKMLTMPDVAALGRIRQVCKDGVPFEFLINYSVFEDPEYLERLGLVGNVLSDDALFGAYAEAGFKIEDREVYAGDPPVRTMWGRQLIRGSNRKTMLIKGVVS